MTKDSATAVFNGSWKRINRKGLCSLEIMVMVANKLLANTASRFSSLTITTTANHRTEANTKHQNRKHHFQAARISLPNS